MAILVLNWDQLGLVVYTEKGFCSDKQIYRFTWSERHSKLFLYFLFGFCSILFHGTYHTNAFKVNIQRKIEQQIVKHTKAFYQLTFQLDRTQQTVHRV